MSSSALSFFPLLAPGLEGGIRPCLVGLPSIVGLTVPEPEAGISSQSTPAILSRLRKKGHKFARITSDSFASAEEMGTGEDLTMAMVTSDVGNARRLRAVGVIEDPDAGVENNL